MGPVDGLIVRVRHHIPIQNGEMVGFCETFSRFLIWSLDFPIRDSWSLANLALRRRCSRVCACEAAQPFG